MRKNRYNFKASSKTTWGKTILVGIIILAVIISFFIGGTVK